MAKVRRKEIPQVFKSFERDIPDSLPLIKTPPQELEDEIGYFNVQELKTFDHRRGSPPHMQTIPDPFSHDQMEAHR